MRYERGSVFTNRVIQQGGQDSGYPVDTLQTSLSTDREEEGEKGQTSSTTLSPDLRFVGFHLQGENSQCNSRLP